MANPVQAVVFHSHGVGQYVRVSQFPRPGQTIRALSWDNDRDGGKGSNVAIALAKLGVSTAFFGKVGCDIWGDLGEQWMSEAGVDVSALLRSERLRTSTGVVMIDNEGANMIVTRNTSTDFTREEILTALGRFAGAKVFITGFEINVEAALFGAQTAHGMGMTTILNPSPIPERPLGELPYIDVLIVNEHEALELAGLAQDADCLARLEEISARLMERYRVGSVIMTLGRHGSFCRSPGGVWRHGAVEAPVVDTTGAGDGFLAAVAAKLIGGSSLPEACGFANAFSAYSVGVQGTFPSYPTLEQLTAFLEERTKVS
ncbi:ribokinase [Feifania hominis]|uniref:Ribokinase n=1 Tax=Feifania hominis TaxID=2763660 RepID=A0A926DDI0_9FIRM|nr:ribokinase [Feifania hominis]MBC8536965.1 ribokinase [Feifania hominis]